MTEARGSFGQRLQQMGSLSRAAVLAGILLAATVLLLPIAYTASGPIGLAACGFAFIVCALPALMSLAISELFTGPQRALYGLLVGMFLRMALPLTACFAAYAVNSPLAQAGLAFYVLPLYLLTLLIETVLVASAAPHSALPTPHSAFRRGG